MNRLSPPPLFLLLATSLLLAGCGFTPTAANGPASTSFHLQGSVHGGNQPVSGASIQLFAAGTTGYGTGASALLTRAVSTDAQGSFVITGDYTCPTQNSQLYIVAAGGNPGLPAGTNNNALKLMAALGSCNAQLTLDPNLFIGLDEVTTVAAAYALSGFFAPDASQIGASATNATGLANAFLTTANLADLTSGTALATAPNGIFTAPQTTTNALANILSACVNSNGTGAPCSTLFAAATPPGGAAPTNTLQAALNIAQHPGNNVSALFATTSSTPPFQPTLPTAPNDWTLQVMFISNGSDSSIDMGRFAIDANGNLWVAGQNPFVFTGYLLEFSNNGTLLSNAPFNATSQPGYPNDLAFDPAGNLWVLTISPFNIVKISPTGAILSGPAGFSSPVPYNTPASLALDSNGNAWFTSSAPQANPHATPVFSLYELDPNGNNLSGAAGFGSPNLTSAYNLAADSAGDMWVSDLIGTVFTKFAPDGSTLATNTVPNGGINSIAVDGSNNVWLEQGGSTSALLEYSPSGVVLNGPNGYTGCNSVPSYGCDLGGFGFALDGVSNLWVNTAAGPLNSSYTSYVTEVSPTGNVLSGPLFGYKQYPGNIQIDSSGNVWQVSTGIISEFVGAAVPVATPYALAAKNGKLASRP